MGSVLITALYLRVGEQIASRITIRKHFYWLPFIPPFLNTPVSFLNMGWILNSVAIILRRSFAMLSGN